MGRSSYESDSIVAACMSRGTCTSIGQHISTHVQSLTQPPERHGFVCREPKANRPSAEQLVSYCSLS